MSEVVLANTPRPVWLYRGPGVAFPSCAQEFRSDGLNDPQTLFSATNGSDDASGIVVKPLEPGALGLIDDWVTVWNDEGSGNETDFSLWRGVPEDPNHVVLGRFFVRNHRKPTIDDARGMKTVHKDILIKVDAVKEVWIDEGSNARANGALWNISTVGNLQAIDAGAFLPVLGYNNPPEDTFAIDHSKITLAPAMSYCLRNRFVAAQI